MSPKNTLTILYWPCLSLHFCLFRYSKYVSCIAIPGDSLPVALQSLLLVVSSVLAFSGVLIPICYLRFCSLLSDAIGLQSLSDLEKTNIFFKKVLVRCFLFVIHQIWRKREERNRSMTASVLSAKFACFNKILSSSLEKYLRGQW